MARTPSALLWRVGEGLADNISELSFLENPAAWVNDNFTRLSWFFKDEEMGSVLSTQQIGHLELEKPLFPRLTTYICARLKLFNDKSRYPNLSSCRLWADCGLRNLEELLRCHSQWSSLDNVAQIMKSEEILKRMISFSCNPNACLMSWERSLLADLHRLDQPCFAARALLVCSDLERIQYLSDNTPGDAQRLSDILNMLLDYELLATMRPTLEKAISILLRRNTPNAAKSKSGHTAVPQPWISDITGLLPPPHIYPTVLNDTELSRNLKGDEIVIAVMGPSGTGKSTFINKLLGQDVSPTSGGLLSCTQQVRAFGCIHPRRSHQKVVVVDTPGFDDTNKNDYEVLKDVAGWLEQTYHNNIKLSGMLQFHNIHDSKMRGTPHRNLGMFQRLCGTKALKNVILVTSFWDAENERVGSTREQQLSDVFWAPLIQNGSRIDRFDPPTHERAWEIIDRFPRTPIALTIQEEMVDERKKLWETSAFKFLVDWWKGVVKALKGSKKVSALQKFKSLESPPTPDLSPKWFSDRRKQSRLK